MSRVQVRWIVLAGVALGLVALVVWLFLPRPVVVDTAAATRGPIDETVQDQGYARVKDAYVISSPVSGRLERLPLKVGDLVKEDAVVARVRPSPADLLDPRTRAQAEAAVAAAGAAVSSARAQNDRLAAEAVRADRVLARTRALAEKGFAARQALDNADADDRAARAAVEAARSDLRAREAELKSARSGLIGPGAGSRQVVEVRAPTSGYVTRVLQESERVVPMGAQLVEIGARRGLEAQIEFLSQDAVKIRPGMAAEIYDWGGSGVIPARVRLIEPQGFTKVSALGVEEQRALVMLQFTGRSDAWSGLGPGYRVWARVFIRRDPAVLKAPLGALVRDAGGWAVYRVKGGRARLTKIDVGAMTDREAEVIRGLDRGDVVIVFPSDRVRDGAEVRPRAQSRR